MNQNRAKLKQIQIADIEGLSDYLNTSQLREITLRSVSTDDLFIEHAKEAVFNQFILRHKYHIDESSDVLSRLKREGYTSHEIAIAIARAVLQESDSVELEQHGVMARYTKTPYLVLYAAVLSLLTLLILLYLGLTISASVTMGLLQFEPILAFFGVLFGVVYFWVFRQIFNA